MRRLAWVVAVLVLLLVSRLRGQREVSVGSRSLKGEAVQAAPGLVVGAIALLAVGQSQSLRILRSVEHRRSQADRWRRSRFTSKRGNLGDGRPCRQSARRSLQKSSTRCFVCVHGNLRERKSRTVTP